jgi:sterol desaturase/sphingolipid hydroxylase (fatty acid hydroxylase superfamily)
MIGILVELLSKQDATKPHTLLTRLVVSLCISVGSIVLYGFYGLIAAIAVYLVGVELMDLPINWMFFPFFVGLLIGCWKSFLSVRDYWKNCGYADSQ